MILAMAIVTTMAMPPMLRWALARVPLREEEKARLDREAFDAEGFVTNMERLLEELSFEAADMHTGKVLINAAYVQRRLDKLTRDEDLSKFIL